MDSLSNVRLFIQEIILCGLRDYEGGKMSRDEIADWLSDFESMHFFAEFLETTTEGVIGYIEGKVTEIDKRLAARTTLSI